jgi:hypothetical protein
MLTIVPPYSPDKQGSGGSRQLTLYPVFQVEPLDWIAWTIPGTCEAVHVDRIHISVSHVGVGRLSVAKKSNQQAP